MVLSPRIWTQLMRVQGWFPAVLGTEVRPRVLSPDIDLQLLHIFTQMPVLDYRYEPRVGVTLSRTMHSGAQPDHPHRAVRHSPGVRSHLAHWQIARRHSGSHRPAREHPLEGRLPHAAVPRLGATTSAGRIHRLSQCDHNLEFFCGNELLFMFDVYKQSEPRISIMEVAANFGLAAMPPRVVPANDGSSKN